MKNQLYQGTKKKLPNPLDYGKPFLSLKESAECLCLSDAEAYKFFNNNDIPMARNGKRYLIPALIVRSLQTGEYFHDQITTSRTD